MQEAGTNRPYGRAYTAAHARLLEHFKLADRIKDPGDRQRLVAVMDNLPAIERWLETLTKEERRRWTHPSTIYKQWQKSQLPARTYEGRTPAAGKQVTEEALTDKVDALRKENTQLKIEAGKRSEVDFRSDIGEIETYLRSRILSEHTARRLRDVLLELYPLPLPTVPVTHPDASTDDDIGLH